MLSIWTDHLKTKEEREEFTKMLKSSTALKRLKELLEQEMQSMDRKEATEAAYDSPSWAYLQAHRNGSRAAWNRLQTLLNMT